MSKQMLVPWCTFVKCSVCCKFFTFPKSPRKVSLKLNSLNQGGERGAGNTYLLELLLKSSSITSSLVAEKNQMKDLLQL